MFKNMTDRQADIADEHAGEFHKDMGFAPGTIELASMLDERAKEEQEFDPELAAEIAAIAKILWEQVPA